MRCSTCHEPVIWYAATDPGPADPGWIHIDSHPGHPATPFPTSIILIGQP